ncbi:GNAT family N-acetyltransferase [Rossellomorea sp. NPDC071047]|uniref:GNAT family N-acetyltransferase n=1 Tax=Rossellomorea sp. NPDC071047 TaxID=3390675 RepID=UPI003D071636
MKVSDDLLFTAIESHHWDYPDRLIPSEVDSLHSDGIVAIKNKQLKNVFANKVPKFIVNNMNELHVKWKVIEGFYGKESFSMWIREPLIDQEEEFLQSRDGILEERYEGLVFDLYQSHLIPSPSHRVITVESDLHIHDLVEISSSIWGYREEDKAVIFKQRKEFMSKWGPDGGFTLAYNKEGHPVGYGNFRYSRDHEVLYLNGGGVLQEARHGGVYSSLVAHRLDMAKRAQCRFVTCQARVGHSAPILKRLGFQPFSTYQYWVVNRKVQAGLISETK